MTVCQTRSDYDFNYLEQCLNNSSNNWMNGSKIYEKDVEKYVKNNGFLLSVGFVIALVLDTEIFRHKFHTIKSIFSEEVKLSILSKLLSLLCLLVSLVISPLILIIFSICFIYQTIVHFVLKYKFGRKYIGLLEGTDAVWAIEDVSKSIINILAITNIEDIEEFKKHLTDKLYKILEDKKFAKLRYNRQKYYGYYFWMENTFNSTNNINYLKTITSSNENYLNKEEILQLLSEYSNKILPNNHTSSWEILVGKQKVKTNKENENNYPVLFRFHHSVGDGIALITILLEAADDRTNETETKYNDSKDKTLTTTIKLKLLSFFQTLLSIIFVPAHLIQMNLMKSIDESILHGNILIGDKTLAWISENDDFPILQTIKYIKSKVAEVSFLDVVLAALSEAFCEYFEQKSSEIPSTVTAVILERVDKIRLAECSTLDNSSLLQNRFTVGMVNLPILPASSPHSGISPGRPGVVTNDTGTGSDFVAVARLQEVNRETSLLKTASPDYQINYWLLKVVSKLLPEPILRPMLHSAHSTMVVSNILGPHEVTICNGHLIKDLIFWLPHRGLTGIGISLISYAGKLQIGISADKALISQSEDAELILQNFVKSLKLFNEKLKDSTAHF